MGASCCHHDHKHDHDHKHGHDHAHEDGAGRGDEPTPFAGTAPGGVFLVAGLDCAEEVVLLRAEVGPLVGGADRLAFDVLNAKMTVLVPGIPAASVMAAVARTGMTATPWGEASGPDAQDRRRRLQAVMAAASGAMTGFGLVLEQLAAPPPASRAVLLVAIVIGLVIVLPKAAAALRRLRPDMNLLMTVAVAGALILGDWLEAATVSFLFALSLALESWSAGRARRAIAALMDLTPPTARVRGADGIEREMAPAEVPVGAVFVVHPGERIPLDGRVVTGESAVNQAPITGESVPVAKAPGAELFAGTVNGDGTLEAENLKAAADTTLARVARLVSEAQSRRSATERWVDRFAAIYTPAVMVLALAIMVVPPLAFGLAWADWVYRALVLLVIACPCALVISTPVTVVAAMAAAARNGVLVKGGEHLETPARLRLVAFDKTGTITEGRPAVDLVVALAGHDEAQLLARAAALEARSPHPIAQAILRHAEAKGVAPAPAEAVRVLPGKGVTGTIDGRSYWLGSHRYLEERGAETPEDHALARKLEEEGRSVVVIGSERHVCGMIALSDALRPESVGALADLRRAGIASFAMLTGDNLATAQRIAQHAGIEEVRAELLPEDKVAAIEDLKATHGMVAMVGDGVNDAPAMMRADLAVAMGAAGTDTAIETADIALMADDLGKLSWLVGHSKRMRRVLFQNIAFALGVKLLFTGLAFAGIATLWGAIAADTGASLLVVLNALTMLGKGEA